MTDNIVWKSLEELPEQGLPGKNGSIVWQTGIALTLFTLII